MNYNIRKLRENEQEILAEFLYEAIYVPEGEKTPPKEYYRTTGAASVYFRLGKK